MGEQHQRASTALDADRSKIYVDLIMGSLGEAARQALRNMNTRKYQYQSEFARRCVAEGWAEGEAQGRRSGAREGRAVLILRQLTLRFGALDSDLEYRSKDACIAELDEMGERLLSASTVQEALGPPLTR